MTKSFVIGVLVGAVVGGTFCLSLARFNRNQYEFIPLSHGSFSVLKVDKRTGESWTLTALGKWLLTADDEENAERKRKQ
jgi:hypothetical protein